jgi:hypothetical protein
MLIILYKFWITPLRHDSCMWSYPLQIFHRKNIYGTASLISWRLYERFCFRSATWYWKAVSRVSRPRIFSESRHNHYAWSADKCVSTFVNCFQFKCLWMNKCRQLINRTCLAFYFVFTSSNKIFPLLSTQFENTGNFNVTKRISKLFFWDFIICIL